jgi:hypothetical protein
MAASKASIFGCLGLTAIFDFFDVVDEIDEKVCYCPAANSLVAKTTTLLQPKMIYIASRLPVPEINRKSPQTATSVVHGG